MGILPPMQATLNLVAFIVNLIDLKHFNTILVLHDQTTRDRINVLIENLQPRYDVAWMLINEYENAEYWNHTITQHQSLLILTAVQTNKINPLLTQLYVNRSPLKRSKNIIVLSDNIKFANRLLSSLLKNEINAVLVDWTRAKVVFHAWNPYSKKQFIRLNETEFLRASNAADFMGVVKYTGLYFDQLKSMQGRSTRLFTVYDPKNVYNIISKDSETSIDGTEIRLIDLIGNAMQSPIEFIVLKAYTNTFNCLKHTYMTYAPIQRRRIQILNLERYYTEKQIKFVI